MLSQCFQGHPSSEVIIRGVCVQWDPIVYWYKRIEDIRERLNTRDGLRNKASLAAITSTFSATVTAVAATMAATVATAMTTFLAFLGDCFGLQGLQFKLRNFAFTAAWPHAWPLAKTFFRWLLAALATWIVDACSKCDWECH